VNFRYIAPEEDIGHVIGECVTVWEIETKIQNKPLFSK
jgi:hypothetical protein